MRQDSTLEAVGGWLKNADATMERRHRRLNDIEVSTLNPENLAYFEDYRCRHFNGQLLPEQGVEEILDALSTHGGTPGRWADLGAGVTTLFWSIGVDTPRTVVACDLVPEALSVLATFKESNETPPCYEQAMVLMDLSKTEFDATRRRPWDYHVFDCHVPWTLPEYKSGFDLITAIGCFGLAPDAQRYAKAFGAAAANLRPGGRFIGVDWIRSAKLIEREGHDNGYVASSLNGACGADAGLLPVYMTRVTIQGDPYYDAALVWAFSA